MKILRPLDRPVTEPPKPRPAVEQHELELGTIIDACTFREGECLTWSGPVNNKGLPFLRFGYWTSLSLRRLQYHRFHPALPFVVRLKMTCGNSRCLEVTHMVPWNYKKRRLFVADLAAGEGDGGGEGP